MEKICLWCNRVYKTYHRKQKFCDLKCQAKACGQTRRGIHFSPATEWKPGSTPACPIKKGEHISRATELKKGHNWPFDIQEKRLENIRIAAEKRIDPDNRPTITCPICHKSFSDFKSNDRRFCSRKCYELFPKSKDTLVKMGKNHRNMKGSLSPSWKGGISFEPYDPKFNSKLKELIRFRDGYKCQKCGCPEIENGRKLSVHHIDGNKLNSFPTNLISLCIRCNVKVEYDRPKWQRIFQRKIQKLMSSHPLQLNIRTSKSSIKGASSFLS